MSQDQTETATPRLGVLEAVGDEWKVRFVRVLPHPIERVWRAVTEPAELAEWFPTTIDGERRAGAALTFRSRGDEAPPFDGLMEAFEPPRLLEFWWGSNRIRIELDALAGGTRLTLSDTLEAYGTAARQAAGWHVCLDRLELHQGSSLDRQTDWQGYHTRYVENFGLDAATIGPPQAHA